MRKYEYKFAEIVFDSSEVPYEIHLINALNQFGEDGWSVINLEEATYLRKMQRGVKALLQREIVPNPSETIRLA